MSCRCQCFVEFEKKDEQVERGHCSDRRLEYFENINTGAHTGGKKESKEHNDDTGVGASIYILEVFKSAVGTVTSLYLFIFLFEFYKALAGTAHSSSTSAGS